VIVWDCGVYSPDEELPWVEDRAAAEKEVLDGLANGKLSVMLRGEKVKGSLRPGAHQGRQDVVTHQAQGPVRHQIGRYGAGPLGALGHHGGGDESDAGADAGGAS
jgi:hypothetical protein